MLVFVGRGFRFGYRIYHVVPQLRREPTQHSHLRSYSTTSGIHIILCLDQDEDSIITSAVATVMLHTVSFTLLGTKVEK
jgi:hypothetical protein